MPKKLGRRALCLAAAKALEQDADVLAGVDLQAPGVKYNQLATGSSLDLGGNLCGTMACAGGWIGIRSPRRTGRIEAYFARKYDTSYSFRIHGEKPKGYADFFGTIHRRYRVWDLDVHGVCIVRHIEDIFGGDGVKNRTRGPGARRDAVNAMRKLARGLRKAGETGKDPNITL